VLPLLIQALFINTKIYDVISKTRRPSRQLEGDKSRGGWAPWAPDTLIANTCNVLDFTV